MRVRQAIGDAGRQAVAVNEPVDRLGRQRDRVLVAMTAQTYEQRVLVAHPDAVGERVTLTHASIACWTAPGTGTSRSRPPLPRTNSRK